MTRKLKINVPQYSLKALFYRVYIFDLSPFHTKTKTIKSAKSEVVAKRNNSN